MSRFIVVGAGVFGASTALHLARDTSNSEIYLFGLPIDSAQPASIDINKVVRKEYASDLYRSLADEAMRAWQHEDFKSFYHKSGWVVIHGKQDSSLPRPPVESKRMTQKELRQRFDSVFEGCELEGEEDITYDESIAWVEATQALEKTLRLACRAGVIYRTEEITELFFDDKKCNGVNLKSGEQLRGFSVVLAMGPWTGPFIARHSQLQTPIGLFTNAGISTVAITLDEEEAQKYSRMPILVRPTQGTSAPYIPLDRLMLTDLSGEIMPMDNNSRIKVTNAVGFTNGAMATRGPIKGASLTSHLFGENRALLAQFFPQFKAREFSQAWYC